jgi:hypothetical protein
MPSIRFLIEDGFPINAMCKGYRKKVANFCFDPILKVMQTSSLGQKEPQMPAAALTSLLREDIDQHDCWLSNEPCSLCT